MKTITDSFTRTHYSPEIKKVLLEYLSKKDYLEWRSTKKIVDKITGNTMEHICFLEYCDRVYRWNSSEIYHFEKYDLALSDEFINHVMDDEN